MTEKHGTETDAFGRNGWAALARYVAQCGLRVQPTAAASRPTSFDGRGSMYGYSAVARQLPINRAAQVELQIRHAQAAAGYDKQAEALALLKTAIDEIPQTLADSELGEYFPLPLWLDGAE